MVFFQAVIFVIDSSNRDRLTEAQDELVKLLSEKELKDACLLILTNKQVSMEVWNSTLKWFKFLI
jgi:GTPase SAR1 family protein